MPYVILGTNPPVNKTVYQISEDIYDYIRAQWSLTGNLAIGNFDDNNKPNPNRNYWIFVQHESLFSNRVTLNSIIGYSHRFLLSTIAKKAKASSPYEITELGDMLSEVDRILWQYPEHGIPGIKSVNDVRVGGAEDVSNRGSAWAKSWEIMTSFDITYEKTTI